jgi:hypothetical protein
MDLNPRIFALLTLFGLIFLGVFGTPYLFPHPKIINQSNNTTIIYKTIEKIVTVTPTIDGHIYFASEYQNGTRLLQRPFSWIRYNAIIAQNANSSVNNNYEPDGLKYSSPNPENKPDTQDMKVTTIVYDYKIFNKLHQFNPADYKYDEILPEGNNKFLLVFIYVFMDDIIGDDTRMWAFNRSFFAVYDGKNTYRQKEYPYQLRFKELEETFTFNNEYRVQAFKSFRAYSKSGDYVSTVGEYNDEIYYLRGGKSNAIDGFLIYEIPVEDRPEDLTVLAQFYAFGSSAWKLRI